MDLYDRKFEALLMDASEGTSGLRLMDDLTKSMLYRWMGTGSICLTVNMYV
jgi:hypothetical protein